MNEALNERRNGQVMVRGAAGSRTRQSEEVHFECDFPVGSDVRSLLSSKAPFPPPAFCKMERHFLHLCLGNAGYTITTQL